MCVCVCVFVCVYVCVCVCVCVYVCVCVRVECVCLCVRTRTHVCVRTGVQRIDTTAVTVSISPNPVSREENDAYTVRCDFNITFGYVKSSIRTRVIHDYKVLVSMEDLPAWGSGATDHLKNRGSFAGSKAEGYLSLTMSDVSCADAMKEYYCFMFNGNIYFAVFKIVNVLGC